MAESLGHGGLGADYMYEVKTFVRKKDLVPVLSEVYTNAFDDGTSVKLYPGVAIGIPWGGNKNQRAISVQQLHFKFNVPDELLSLSYYPELFSLEELDKRMMLDEKAMLSLGYSNLFPVSQIRPNRLRTPVDVIKNELGNFIRLRENGIELILRTSSDLVSPYVPNINRPIMTARYQTAPRWYYRVNEGTTIYWEDGLVAGKVRQFFGYQSETPPVDGLWCEIRSEFLKNEELCFRTADIEVIDNGVE